MVRPLVQKADYKYYKTTDLCQAVCIASGFGYSSKVWISSDQVTLSKNPDKEQNFVVKVYVEQARMFKKPHFCTSLSRFPFRKERQNDQQNNVSKLTFTVMGFILRSNTEILHFFPSQKPLCAVGGW